VKTADFAVIGGGILGLMAAFTARSCGATVMLFEAGTVATGASVRNFGQIVPSGQATGLWRSLGVRSLSMYRALAHRFSLPIRTGGSLYVASDGDELQLLVEMQAFNERTGYPSELLSPRATCTRQAGLAQDYVRGGLFYPEEMTADSPAVIAALTAGLREDDGCAVHTGHRISAVDARGPDCRLVSSEGDVFEAAQVLVACGAALSGPFASLMLDSGMQICRLQMMRTEAIPDLTLGSNLLTGLSIRRYPAFRVCPSRAVMKTPPQLEALEAEGVHLLFTQRADGSLIVGDSHAWMPARHCESLDYRIDLALNTMMLDEARRILGRREIPVRETWNGYYAEHPDGVYARSINGQAHLLTGIGGKGMTTGPAVAERATRRILESGGPIDELFVEKGSE
jgi:FAD dependent oxidoreductase TIGR03364